ncbi:MAG: right-handed parallel beta-helix repeat-containing protein [Bdellovibrionia bacterium]
MRDLSAFLKTSIVASSVVAAVSVTAVAADTVPPFAGIQPFPGSRPNYTGSTVDSAYRPPNDKIYSLNCGTTYSGPLNLSGSTNITIQPATACASGQNPVIIPGAPLNGSWAVYDSANNIYAINVNFQIGQVFVNSQLLGIAHYPDSISEAGWLQLSAATDLKTYNSAASMTINFRGLPGGLQSADLQGAQLTYRGSYPWSIGTRNVSSYNPSTGDIVMDPIPDFNMRAEDASNIARFYLEGKPWMLSKMSASSSGWAFVGGATGGKLYVKLASGQVPGNLNIWGAAPVRSVIDARGSSGVTIKNVRIVGGDIGIDASYLDSAAKAADNLQVLNSEVSYSNWSAIYASNATRLVVDHSTINGALHSGIYARVGTTNATVTNSTFNYVNNIGMHKGGDAAVYINYDTGPTGPAVNANFFNWVGKEAVSVGQSTNANVNYNVITGACRNHGDCGAIYLFSPSSGHHALNASVINNNVKYVNGDIIRPGGNSPERYAIYLDDFANGVLVKNNSVQANDSGMQIHNGFNNAILSNTFGGNAQRDIMFSDSGYEDGLQMSNNVIYSNTFNGPEAAFSFYFNQNSGNRPPLAGVASPAAVLYSSSADVNTYNTAVISDTNTGLLIAPVGPNWVKCATEYGTCTFSGTKTVRYGAGTSWATRVATGSIACNNSVFGDPAYGSAKECDVDMSGSPAPSPSPTATVAPSPTPTVTAPNWVKCAVEGGACSFSGTYTVRYGTGASWSAKTLSNGTACSNSVFGDPASGYAKECDVDMNSGSSPSPAPSASPSPTPTATATTWTKCADENGTCTFSGTKTVRYGAGTSWATKVATGSIGCNNAVFGDPAYGTAKECDVSQ